MEWRALVSGLGFMFLIPRVVRISSFRCYATVGNARSCYIDVLARGEQGVMCGFDAHRVTPPLEYGLLLRSRASKVLRAGMYADVKLHQVGCVLVNVIACTNACVRAQVARFPG